MSPGGIVGRVALAVAGLAVALGLAEGVVRVVNPTPRAQIVDPERVRAVRQVDGTWLWTWETRPSSAAWDCPRQDAVEILVTGSSILYGVGLEVEDSLAGWLQRVLPISLGRPVCVYDVSQPGYDMRAKAAAAREWMSAHGVPDLLILELWQNDGGRYRDVGRRLVNLREMSVVDDRPGFPPFLPRPVYVWGFESSALFRYASLALSWDPDTQEPDARERLWRDVMSPVFDAVARGGGQTVLVLAPPLSRPFAEEAVRERQEPWAYADFIAWAERDGLGVWSIAENLSGEDVTALRRDACCHYNEAGMARVADRFIPEVVDRLSSR